MHTRQANVYQTSQCMLNEPVHLGQAVDVKYDHAIVYVYTRTCVREHICVFAFIVFVYSCVLMYSHSCVSASPITPGDPFTPRPLPPFTVNGFSLGWTCHLTISHPMLPTTPWAPWTPRAPFTLSPTTPLSLRRSRL